MNRLLAGTGLVLLGASLWHTGALALPGALLGLAFLSLRVGGDSQKRRHGA